MEYIKDYLLLEEEFIQNQEQLKLELSREEKNQDKRSKVDYLHGTTMVVSTLEEIINNDHAIISTASGAESYAAITSFIDKDHIELGCLPGVTTSQEPSSCWCSRR
jgi:26S proteasome regulatory subunit T2